MIKDKEKILQEKGDKILEQLKVYLENMDTLSDTNEFTIDKIESMWGELEVFTKQVYREINAEIIKQVDERDLITLKKKNMPKKV